MQEDARTNALNATPEPAHTSGRYSFANPPVVETALGVQFDELKGFKSIHFGLYAARVLDRYPRTQDHPRLGPIIETFPPRPKTSGLAFFSGTRLDRVFYLNSDGSELLQLQPDRFSFNWKLAAPEAAYPRYSHNSVRFLEEYRSFVRFCEETDNAPVKPRICEVTYVNQIFPEMGEGAIELFAKLFTGISWQSDFGPTPELASLNRTFVIDQNAGRLYVEAHIALDKERGQYVLFKLIGRTLHTGDADVADTLRLAHDSVIEGFVGLTDETMRRERWNQTVTEGTR